MNIALVAYGDLAQVSGGNLYDRLLVDHLTERGHTVEILPLPLVDYDDRLVHNDDPTLLARLSSDRFDVVLQDELTHPSLYRANATLVDRTNARLVSVVHHLRISEDWPREERARYREVEEAYLRGIHAFVFNSETTRESVEALLQVKTLHVVATPGGDRLESGLDRAAVHERTLGALSRPRRLLFVGNVIPRKGLAVLIEALGKLRDREWSLDVVGSEEVEPAHAREIRARIEERDLEDRVHFHGILSGDELAHRYRRSDALVVPSSYEGFGIVYLEAMAFGLPVVAGSSGAADEIVRHERTGFLVQPEDVFGLTTQIGRLVDDGELLTRLSITAYEVFSEHPTWAQSMTSIEAFLETLG